MEQSSELKDLMLRFYEAFSRGDTAFMERIISNQADVLMIGSDPNEWWAGTATIMQALKAQVQAGIQAIPGDLKAYREGSVGWIADSMKFVLPDGIEVPARFTIVFHQEDGEWKLVQGHASVGVPNEALGTDLNV